MLRPEHAILRGPFAVDAGIEPTPTPENFKKWDPKVGDTVPTFAVFTASESERDEPGLVTSNFGFEDRPDAERIAGGINMKGPQYAAIARHGSFVMWGFHTLPDRLTPAGRRLYLNTLAYAVAHRGALVETLRLRPARSDLLDALTVLLHLYAEPQRMGMLQRHFAGEGIPSALLHDPAAARAWYAERAPFLHPVDDGSDWATAYQLTVDPQCRELGVANDALAFLDALARRLADDPLDALATSLLARYVPDVDPARFDAWLRANREKLYFTETGGWVWRVRGTAAPGIVLRADEPPAADEPVLIEADLGERTLTITLRIRAGWHVYSPRAKDGEPVTFRFLDGSSFAPNGEALWDDTDDGVLSGIAQIRIPIRKVRKGSDLRVAVTHVACDAQTCRPPATVILRR